MNDSLNPIELKFLFQAKVFVFFPVRVFYWQTEKNKSQSCDLFVFFCFCTEVARVMAKVRL